MRNLFLVVILLVLVAAVSAAQDEKKNELAATIGRTFISDQTVPNTSFFDNTVHSGKGLSFDFSYVRVLRRYRWGSLSAEVPFLWNPDEDLNYGLNEVPVQYSSMFLTPAARARFLEDLAFHPWVSFGGGVGRFVASKDLVFSVAIPAIASRQPACWTALWASMFRWGASSRMRSSASRRVTTGVGFLPSTWIRERPASTICTWAAV